MHRVRRSALARASAILQSKRLFAPARVLLTFETGNHSLTLGCRQGAVYSLVFTVNCKQIAANSSRPSRPELDLPVQAACRPSLLLMEPFDDFEPVPPVASTSAAPSTGKASKAKAQGDKLCRYCNSEAFF